MQLTITPSQTEVDRGGWPLSGRLQRLFWIGVAVRHTLIW